DAEALRTLFSELEFTTLLKELVPEVEVRETDYRELKTAAEVRELRKIKTPLAIAFEFTAIAKTEEDEPEEEAAPASGELLFDARPAEPSGAPLKLAISTEAGKAFSAVLDGDEVSTELKRLLSDPKIPKTIHDYKAALRQLEPHGVELTGVGDEPMLYSYI